MTMIVVRYPTRCNTFCWFNRRLFSLFFAFLWLSTIVFENASAILSTLSPLGDIPRMTAFSRTNITSHPRLFSVQIQVNGQARDVDDRATVEQLLTDLGLSVRHMAVELNLKIVPRSRHAETILSPGDALEVVTLVGGG